MWLNSNVVSNECKNLMVKLSLFLESDQEVLNELCGKTYHIHPLK